MLDIRDHYDCPTCTCGTHGYMGVINTRAEFYPLVVLIDRLGSKQPCNRTRGDD